MSTSPTCMQKMKALQLVLGSDLEEIWSRADGDGREEERGTKGRHGFGIN